MIWTKELAMTSFHNGLNARTKSNHRWTHVRSENWLSPTRAPWPWHTKIGYGWNPQDTCKCQGAKLRVYRSSVLWKTLLTPGHEFKALDAMNSLRLWMTWTTLGCELRALDAMKNLSCVWYEWLGKVSSRFYMLWTTQHSGWHEWLQVMRSELLKLWTTQGGRWHEQLGVVSLVF